MRVADYLVESPWRDSDSATPELRGEAVGDILDGWVPEYGAGPIELDEVDAVLRRMAKSTSPGPDEIPAEMLRLLDDDNRTWMESVLTRWYQLRMVLE